MGVLNLNVLGHKVDAFIRLTVLFSAQPQRRCSGADAAWDGQRRVFFLDDGVDALPLQKSTTCFAVSFWIDAT